MSNRCQATNWFDIFCLTWQKKISKKYLTGSRDNLTKFKIVKPLSCQTTIDWLGIVPQVPHEILNYWNFSLCHLIGGLLLRFPIETWIMETFLWGVLLQFPMKYESVLLRDLRGHVIDLGTTPLVPHWGGFQFIGFMHCILPTKIFIVCLNISKGKTLCIIPINKAWSVHFFTGLE